MNEPNDNPDIHMISQPLMTKEGFINPACMNELTDAINNSPKDFVRLSQDDEWNSLKHQWTTKCQIVGAFAKWACRQSPYGVPDDLETVCKFLNVCLDNLVMWNEYGMKEMSLCEINKLLHDILYEQGVTLFDDWNKCKAGETPDIIFTSRYSGKRNPDHDFIDLNALLRNVCLDIRSERRENRAFDEKFNKEWEARNGSKPTDNVTAP